MLFNCNIFCEKKTKLKYTNWNKTKKKLNLIYINNNYCTDVATVLVVDNNNRAAHGRFLNIKPEIGLLKSTARTFINDGIKTEYVTQVIGTNLANGQYVQLLTTTSRVLYNVDNSNNLQTKTINQNAIDKDSSDDQGSYFNAQPSSPFLHNVDYIVPNDPYLVFPARKAHTNEVVYNNIINNSDNDNQESEIRIKAEKLVELSKNPELPKPNKVISDVDLPTYTVSHDSPVFRAGAVPTPSPRSGKVISYNEEVEADNNENKVFPSVTYFGFADFTTTVGDTVIIFSPSTTQQSIDANHITSIKGEPTLNIKPTITKQQHITFESAKPTKPMKVVQNEPKILETAVPTLSYKKPTYKEIVRQETTTENLPETTIEEMTSEEEEDEEMEDDEEEEGTTPLPPTLKPILNEIGITTPESIESSQTSSVLATLSKPSNEDVLRIFASLASLEEAKKQQELNSVVPKPMIIDTTPIKSQEPETKVFTGFKTIFFEDITTTQETKTTKKSKITTLPPPTTTTTEETTESDEAESEEDSTTESATTTTTTEKAKELRVSPVFIATQPLTPKPPAEDEKYIGKEPVKEPLCSTTQYKTLTYLTTFYIPVDDVITTTSIKSNSVVESSVISTECAINPTAVISLTTQKASITTKNPIEDEEESTTFSAEKETTPSSDETTVESDGDEEEFENTTKPSKKSSGPTKVKEIKAETPAPETTTMEIVTESNNVAEETTIESSAEDDDIEVVYKTLYTTYTYLTTFFQESTSVVSSRKEVVTNIITSTINGNDFSNLLNNLEASKKVDDIRPTQVNDVAIVRSTEKFVIPENDFIGVNQLFENEKVVDYTPALNDEDLVNSEIKTLYTTYTYFTTLFNEGKSEVVSRTEVYTNIIDPTATPSLQKDVLETKFVYDIEKINNSLNEDNSSKKEAKKLKFEGAVDDNNLEMKIKSGEQNIDGPKSYSTMVRGGDLQSSAADEGDWDEQIIKTVGDVKSSTSDGERSYIENIDRNWNVQIDDQISSESNTEERIPSPTLLLQTRYTTFTYFTTMYVGSTSSNILSRLETLTNVVTETLSPTQVQKLDDATLPVTYFTTYTYWTTFYKDGTTKTTSREETVSNVVSPTPLASSVELETTLATSVVALESSIASTLLVAPLQTLTPLETKEEVKESIKEVESSLNLSSSSSLSSSVVVAETESTIAVEKIESSTVSPKALEPSTFFTTYTYYTTGYVGDETVINSRFETVENIVIPTVTVDQKQGARAIDVNGKGNALDSGDEKSGKPKIITPANEVDEKIVNKEVVATVQATPALEMRKQTGVVSINHGKIIDADGISTTHFTTQAIGTYVADFYAEVLETSSSVEIDEIRKSLLPTETEVEGVNKQHKTGLVRLIDGTIIDRNGTTLYESKVIGTFIDGRYAQVIESTSSIIAKQIEATIIDNRLNIEPTAVTGGDVTSTSLLINPTPAVLEGSIVESQGNEEDSEEEEEEEGEDGDGRVKTRLSFKSKKRTFTPVIRPFASRSRLTFNPKRKNATNGPAIVTPTDVTPTIKATAVKTADGASRNRFAGPKRSSGTIASINPSSSSGVSFGGSSSRRTFARPSSSRAALLPSSTIRSPASSRPGNLNNNNRIQPSSPIAGGNRRTPFRSSIGNRFASASSSGSVQPTISARPRIRPTLASSLDRTTNQATQTTPESDDDNTTNVTDDPNDVDEDGDNPTDSVATTTENSRRNGNPLLRFRRPPAVGRQTPAASTARSVQITTRRNPLARTSRASTPATTTTTLKPRNRNLIRPSLPPVQIGAGRGRTSSSNLFPPRGLFSRTTPAPQELEEDNGEEENQSGEEFEYEDTNISEVKAKRRVKRQAEYGTRAPAYNSRFKRPTTARAGRAEQYSSEEILTEAPKTRSTSRYNARARNSDTKDTANSRIKPTSSSQSQNRLLFTLREKDSNPNPVTTRSNNFRRPTVPSYQKKTAATTRQSNSRFRYNSGQDQYASSRSGSSNNARTRNNANTRRGGTTSRSRSRTDDSFNYVQPNFDGTITVTHHIPTEVTIPIVNGGNTEYKNVITAKLSTEILGPKQYSSSVGANGINTLVLLDEKTALNNNGMTEITQYILNETPTTSIVFTPTTIRGRKTSFSHVVPSTVYDAIPVVSTIASPTIGNNAPLANILLSQLLLGNFGNLGNLGQQQQQNPLLGLQQQQQFIPQMAATPVTEYKTRTTTYVTTLTNGKSTVLPITFRGKEIITTIFDDKTQVITATEFITDTVVITPTQVIGQQQPQQFNSLLLPLLLQQQQAQAQQQQQPNLQNINTLPNSFDILSREALESLSLADEKRIQSVSREDNQRGSSEDYEEEKADFKPKKPKNNKSYKAETPPPPPEKKFDTSIVTLYVSGRRPGEFSTVLSTILTEQNPIYKRSAQYVDVKPSELPSLDLLEAEASNNYYEYILAGSNNDISPDQRSNDYQETESLDFVLGEFNQYTTSAVPQ